MADLRDPARRRLLDASRVEVLGRGAAPDPAAATGAWPCPFCGQRRPVETAVTLHVRNRTRPSHPRDILACGGCASRLVDGSSGNGESGG